MLINLPVDILTGILSIIRPAISDLLIFTIPSPVRITSLIAGFTPWAVISLFTRLNISSILASIISIKSELFIVLFRPVSSLAVFKLILLSFSIYDFKANPYWRFSLSASSFDIPKQYAISEVILSPP